MQASGARMAMLKRTPSTGDLCSDNCLVRDKNRKTKDQKDYLNHCIWAKFVVFFLLLSPTLQEFVKETTSVLKN